MAIMNPSKLRDCYDALPHSNLSETKQKALEALITRYLNGELVPVVRCKECKYLQDCERKVERWELDTDPGSKLLFFHCRDLDFCSRGERKEDEQQE